MNTISKTNTNSIVGKICKAMGFASSVMSNDSADPLYYVHPNNTEIDYTKVVMTVKGVFVAWGAYNGSPKMVSMYTEGWCNERTAVCRLLNVDNHNQEIDNDDEIDLLLAILVHAPQDTITEILLKARDSKVGNESKLDYILNLFEQL